MATNCGPINTERTRVKRYLYAWFICRMGGGGQPRRPKRKSFWCALFWAGPWLAGKPIPFRSSRGRLSLSGPLESSPLGILSYPANVRLCCSVATRTTPRRRTRSLGCSSFH